MIIDLTSLFSSTPVVSDESAFTSLDSLETRSWKFDWDAYDEWRSYVNRIAPIYHTYGFSYRECSRDKWSQKFIPVVKTALGDDRMCGILVQAAPNRTRTQVISIIRNLNCSKLSVDSAAENIVDLDRIAQTERKKERIDDN